RFEHAPPGQRTPFIQTQQGPAARHTPARQLPRVGLGLHNHGDILQTLAEAGRNAFARGGDQSVKFGGLHGRFASCSHSGLPPNQGAPLLLPQPERLHLWDVLIHDAQFPRAIAGEFQLEVHDLVVALVLVIELQLVAFGLGEEERRLPVFHGTGFDQLAFIAQFDAARVQRARDFLAGLNLQHQENLSFMSRFPGARKLGRFGRSTQAHQEKQTGGNAGRCAHRSQFSTLLASAFPLHPEPGPGSTVSRCPRNTPEGGWVYPIAVGRQANHVDLAEDPRLDHFPRFGRHGGGLVLAAYHHHLAALLRGIAEHLAFRDIEGHRLLDVNVLPRRHRIKHHARVPVLGRRYYYRVYVLGGPRVLAEPRSLVLLLRWTESDRPGNIRSKPQRSRYIRSRPSMLTY